MAFPTTFAPVNLEVALPDPIRSIAASTFTGALQAVGTPTLRGIRIIKFINNTTVPVFVSWDGSGSILNDFVPANSFCLYDVASDKTHDDNWYVRVGTQFYVEGSAGTGSFYIVCIG